MQTHSLYENNVTDLLQWGILIISGPDATTFLQGQTTCDVTTLSTNKTTFTAICNRKGRVLATFHLWHVKRQGDEAFTYYLLLPKTLLTLLQSHLQTYARFSKVTITAVEDEIGFGYIGKLKNPDKLTTQGAHVLRLIGNVERYLIRCEQTELATQTQTVDATVWDYLNIDCGQATIYPATQGLFTPQMLDLDKLGGVSFTKGCYVGQEIIGRTHHLGKLKRHLYRLTITANHAPEPGEAISNPNNVAIGTLVTSASVKQAVYECLAVIKDVDLTQDVKAIRCQHQPIK